MRSFTSHRGVSLIDVIVGSALVVVIFLGLFGILRASLQVAGLAKLKASATEIASSRIEYVRSLEYDDVGTVGGIPAGLIPQNATTTNAGLAYGVRMYIAYVDDPADGLGALDSSGITTDYKVVKVTVSYTVNTISRNVTLVTNVAPQGIETTTGGGTLQIRVVDAVGAAVSGATVRIRNASTSPAIDLSTFSDAGGTVFLPGAPTSTEYRVEVSKTGYSSAETYARNATNANPTPGYLTVIAGSTTSGTFAIDRLAGLDLRTFSPIAAAQWLDTFANSSGLVSTTNVQVAGGALSLSGAPGSYASSGSALSTTTAPTYLASWTRANLTTSVVAGTQVRMSVTDGSGTLIPEAVLPGNAAGFTGTVDISMLSTTTYPSLKLQGALTSGNPIATPQVLEWGIEYQAGPTPLPNISFTLTGSKTTGSTSGGAPIYKTTVASTTGASARFIMDLEWDSYALSTPGYDIVLGDPEPPYDLLPDVDVPAFLILTPSP